MTKIDLNIIKEFQEVPNVTIKPLRVLEDRLYFVKILKNSKDEQWIEGIYCYYNSKKKIKRLDEGIHTDFPYKFDIYVPFDEDDIQIYEDMGCIFFSTVIQNFEDDLFSIMIYAIDIETHEQINVFSIKYLPDEFCYMGFRMLSADYLMVELVNTLNDAVKELDKIYILDLYTKDVIELKDCSIKYSLGILQLSSDSKKIFCEEYYMYEEEEISILTTDMYEVDEEVLDENILDVFKNSIKVLDFEKFKEMSIKQDNIDMLEIDSICEEGIIRVIGTTKNYIYYKKSKHQDSLQNSKYLSDRILIGKEEIYALNKSDLSIEKVTNLEIGAILAFENDILNKIFEDSKTIKIVNVQTGNLDYIYKKEEKIEEFIDFIQNKYLLVKVNPNMPSKRYKKLIDIETGDVKLKAKEISSIKDSFFYECLQ